MSLVIALFLVVHASIHVGYVCGPAWPFVAGDPWLVSGLGMAADAVRCVGVALVGTTFATSVLAALAAVGLLPKGLWAPLVAVAGVASAVVLIVFVTPWTLPGLAIDAALVWGALVRRWTPRPVFGR